MTIKLVLLKSGEDIITDVQEMVVGEEPSIKVIGYFFNKPCLVKMKSQSAFDSDSTENTGSSIEVSLYPWMPLSKDETIPVSLDWIVTMVTPTDKLKEMYETDVLNYGKETNKNSSTDEQSYSDQSD